MRKAVSSSQFYFMAAAFGVAGGVCAWAGVLKAISTPLDPISSGPLCKHCARALHQTELHLSRGLVPATTPPLPGGLRKPAVSAAHRGPGSRQRAAKTKAKQFASDRCYCTDTSYFDINYSGSCHIPCSPILRVGGA